MILRVSCKKYAKCQMNDSIVLNDGLSLSHLIDLLAVPVRIDDEKAGGDAIVLSHPQSVHTEQAELFVGAKVAGHEAANRVGFARITLAVHGSVSIEGEVGLLGVADDVEAQLAVIAEQIAQI